MKNWNEAKEGRMVYIVNEIEVFDDNDELLGKTKPYQKAYIQPRFMDFTDIEVVIKGGEFDGYDFYFFPQKDKPSELLTQEEFKMLKLTKIKVWKDLKKFINMIDKLKEKIRRYYDC